MKEFCPTSCLGFEGDDTRLCKPGGKHGVDCWHTKDKAYKGSVSIKMIWYGKVWIDALAVGKNGDDLIIVSDKSEGVTYIKKTSPLIRRVERN